MPGIRPVGEVVGTALGVSHALERPLVREPVSDRAPNLQVELGPARAHPREHARVVLPALIGIDVDAPDDAGCRWIEDRVGKAGSLLEVVGVPLQVAQVVLQAAVVGPGARLPARGVVDVVYG